MAPPPRPDQPVSVARLLSPRAARRLKAAPHASLSSVAPSAASVAARAPSSLAKVAVAAAHHQQQQQLHHHHQLQLQNQQPQLQLSGKCGHAAPAAEEEFSSSSSSLCSSAKAKAKAPVTPPSAITAASPQSFGRAAAAASLCASPARSPLARQRLAAAAAASPRTPLKRGDLGKSNVAIAAAHSPAARHRSPWAAAAAAAAACSPSPRRPKSKPAKSYDRFIPSHQNMDVAIARLDSYRDHIDLPKTLDSDTLAYQEQLAKACGVAIDQRILAYSIEPPANDRLDLRATWHRPLRQPNPKLTRRRIPTIPEKVLDALGIIDDYYLNILDWSSKNVVAVALYDTVYALNADTGSVHEFCQTTGDDYISSLQWSFDGSYLAVGTSQGATQIWDLASLSLLRVMDGRNSRVGVLSWDRHILSSGARDGSIWHQDVRARQFKTAELLGHTSEVCGLKWRPDGQLLASGGNDNLVNIWDVRSAAPKITKTEHSAAVRALGWCPWQLNLLATGGGSTDKMVYFWNTTTGGKVSSVNAGSQVTSIVWSRQYKEFLTSHGFPNNYLSVWTYPSLNKITDLQAHESRVLHTSLSPDGQTVVSGASDESLRFWKVFEARKGKSAPGKTARDAPNNDENIDEALARSYANMTIR